ncbi:hypothetical protein D3C72_1925360 [compost metagenome]
MLGHRQADEAVERGGGFAEHAGTGIGQKLRGPAQVVQQKLRAVAKAGALVLQQGGQIAEQGRIVERHQRAAGNHARVAIRGLLAGRAPVQQGDLEALFLQGQRRCNADHAGSEYGYGNIAHEWLCSGARWMLNQ